MVVTFSTTVCFYNTHNVHLSHSFGVTAGSDVLHHGLFPWRVLLRRAVSAFSTVTEEKYVCVMCVWGDVSQYLSEITLNCIFKKVKL